MNRTARLCLCAFFSVALVAACDTIPTRQYSEAEYEELARKAVGVERWRFEGRVSLTSAEESWHATILWHQDRQNFRIRIIAPLGQKSVEIAGVPGHAQIRDSNGDQTQGQDVELLVEQQLGWRLPLHGLLYWLKAVPDPRFPIDSLKRAKSGLLEQLDQADWHTQYRDYIQVADLTLPVKIFMENPHFKLRLAIRHWYLNEDANI